jgi:hypothetical protein
MGLRKPSSPARGRRFLSWKRPQPTMQGASGDLRWQKIGVCSGDMRERCEAVPHRLAHRVELNRKRRAARQSFATKSASGNPVMPRFQTLTAPVAFFSFWRYPVFADGGLVVSEEDSSREDAKRSRLGQSPLSIHRMRFTGRWNDSRACGSKLSFASSRDVISQNGISSSRSSAMLDPPPDEPPPPPQSLAPPPPPDERALPPQSPPPLR